MGLIRPTCSDFYGDSESMNVGFPEILIGLVLLCIPSALLVWLGFAIGKGVGFKEGIREQVSPRGSTDKTGRP